MQPTIVTAAILRKAQRILITQRPLSSRHGGQWEFPGGKLEPGETPQQALKRELQEELGIDIEVGDIFEVVFHTYDTGSVLILAYECTSAQDTIRHLQVAGHRWVFPAESNAYDILPADRPIIEKLQRLGLPKDSPPETIISPAP